MKLFVSLFLFLISLNIFPQQFSNWNNYTDMKNISDVIISSDLVWCATNGGAFSYNLSNGEFQTFSKSKGLNGTSLTAIAVDKQNKIWFGSESGIIDIYDPSSNSFHTILDIFNSDKTNKRINDITVKGDTIFIATAFGISLIDSKNYSFYDTFFKFGNFSSNIRVNSILITDKVYAATESGVAIQKTGATNLSAPESWDVYNQTNGLPVASISSLGFYQDKLICGSSAGLSFFNGFSWETFAGFTTQSVLDLSVDGNSLYILSPFMVFLFDGTSTNEFRPIPAVASKLAYSQNLGLFVATNKGLLRETTLVFPNGPEANQFPNLVVDGNQTLWSSSGKDISGVGFYSFDGFEWKTYNVQNYPELKKNGFYEVYAAKDNSIYAGNWGNGFSRLKNGTVTRFDRFNTGLIGIPVNNDFIVITGFAEEAKNNLWILNYWAADRNTLAMLTPDSSWYFFSIPAAQNRVLEKHYNLVIDQNGTKWFNSQDEARTGLFYFNERGTYADASDDISGYLNSNNGLTSAFISDIVVDRRGDLWIGTNLGVNIITNLNSVLTSSNPQLRISTSFSVRQQTVNALAVDPLNRKWVGSNEGLFLLSSDGTQLLAALNTKNSPLLSDKITSLAIDEKSGRVYVGSDAGLTSFDTPAILPVESFNGLNIYPNPLIIKDGNQVATIDGLIRDTDIKIVTASGRLIREFSSPGGRIALWDGRDDNGNFVSSGVYIVIAFDKEGNNIETGKIAVLRQ